MALRNVIGLCYAYGIVRTRDSDKASSTRAMSLRAACAPHCRHAQAGLGLETHIEAFHPSDRMRLNKTRAIKSLMGRSGSCEKQVLQPSITWRISAFARTDTRSSAPAAKCHHFLACGVNRVPIRSRQILISAISLEEYNVLLHFWAANVPCGASR